jgi:excisionase family DNA binding protein
MTKGTQRVAYTTGEIATMLGRDRTTVWRWIERGVLQEVKVPGGRRMVTAASLEKLLMNIPGGPPRVGAKTKKALRVGSAGGPA